MKFSKLIVGIVLAFGAVASMASTKELASNTSGNDSPDSTKGKFAVRLKESSDNLEIAGILKLLDASQVTVTIYADSTDAKFYEIWMVERKAEGMSRKKIGYTIIEPDSTKITFTSLAKDSLEASTSIMRLTGGGAPRVNVNNYGTNLMLFGCDYDWKFSENDTIPLVGYAAGIPRKFDLGGGRIVEAYDICGLRFSKVAPYNWKEEFNIPDYLYFEAVPVKEMNPDY